MQGTFARNRQTPRQETPARRLTAAPSLRVRRGGALPRPPFHLRPPCDFVGGDAHIAPPSHERTPIDPSAGAELPPASLCEGGGKTEGFDGGRDMPRQRRGIRGDAPQGYLFRFASLRGHRPLRKVYRGTCSKTTGGVKPRPYTLSTEIPCVIRFGAMWASPPTEGLSRHVQ